jgi:ubiquinone/menaquinone biosynthesis C-methylase UbiE
MMPQEIIGHLRLGQILMSGNPKVELVNRFFSGTGPTYDSVVNLCTFGLDRSWKKKILAKIPEGSVRIMDQACGTGILTFQIAHQFPRSRVIGVELREEYLNLAIEKARGLKISNVEFILGRAEDVLIEESLDCITSSYLAKYAELGSLVRNMKKMLRRGGVLILHDFTHPSPGSIANFCKNSGAGSIRNGGRLFMACRRSCGRQSGSPSWWTPSAKTPLRTSAYNLSPGVLPPSSRPGRRSAKSQIPNTK